MTIAAIKTDNTIEPSLSGFENINRYYDKNNNVVTAKILPGEYYVTMKHEVITTVLGSCISACIRCKLFGIGGMNHFMLPMSRDDGSDSWIKGNNSEATRYGNFAMEHMINDILKEGASRKHLEVKLIGGGQIVKNMSDVGKKNIAFAREYLQMENLEVVGEDVGDIYPRKVIYDPMSGKVKVKKLETLHNDTIIKREETYQHSIEQEPVAGEIELF
ncbi:MAG: chemoreceptor glutamine deamidase CheD [Gammaproteobacteria bacterium]